MQKILLISLGCDKNLVDSEEMLGQLLRSGYEMTDCEEEANVAIVNTCCFIDAAKEESIDAILAAAELKKQACRVLIVTGCLAQRFRDEIASEIPEVDAILGTSEYDRIAETVKHLTGDGKPESVHSEEDARAYRRNRVLMGGTHTAFLKIAEGCDKRCTYCVIPDVRGHYRSIPMEELLDDAKRLVENGTVELILVAQETTRYGTDLYGEKKLPELLRRLAEIPGLRWIRLLYCYPEEITQELIDVIRDEEKVCKYLDLPIQHINDRVLKRMGRRTTKADLVRIIGELRRQIPELTLRTTLISGFPGETDEEHEELLSFVRETKFERLGVFPYSKEDGTPAARLPEQIPEEIKCKRRDEIMELQQQISMEHTSAMVGRTVSAMVEGRIPEEDVYVARTYRDAPDVDGYLFFSCEADLISGTFVTVRVTGANEYDLTGEMIDESAE